ncbi:hypothetical protein N802_18335 [Knoellia sinensis KCTC 19936]|uniref:Uncharacterized protein n=1 Tax=Knoellia sinensis KCTC 19936 TaxID=1385520 RepID=A0A0A0J527_9MICO|nr:hypothetical protein N802_18335 [Knoellia sinensis KCTC 19936]
MPVGVVLAATLLVAGCNGGMSTTDPVARASGSSAVSTPQHVPFALPPPSPPSAPWPSGLTPSAIIGTGEGVAGVLNVEGDTIWTVVDGHAVNLDARTGAQLSSFPVQGGVDRIAVTGEWAWATGELAGVVVQYHLPDGKQGNVVPALKPVDLVIAHGSVWVSQHHEGTVLRIDPITGQTREVQVVKKDRAGPQSLFADDAAVYVTVPRDRALYRIDPRTGATAQLRGEALACGGMEKVGAVIWATGCFSGQQVVGFDTTSRRSAGSISLGERYSEDVALVDGFLWASIAVESDVTGEMVTDRTALALLDPRSRKVVRTLELPDGGGTLAVAGGKLWAVGRTGNTILGFDSSDLAKAARG